MRPAPFQPALHRGDGLEADDLIASYARAAAHRGWDVTIVSSDKDLMQLIGPCGTGHIDMLDTMKNVRIDIPEVIEKFGVAPELVGDVLALMGDAVDNVPGIRGIGPKTATKLIQEHGSLEAALAAAPTMKPVKLQESLIEQADMARLSRVLVQLKEDCDAAVPLDDFKLTAIPPEPLAAFLEEHGFTSLLKRLGEGRGSPERKVQLNPAKPVNAGAVTRSRREPPAAGRLPPIDRSLYACVQMRRRWPAGSSALSRRGWWPSIPKPARSMRCGRSCRDQPGAGAGAGLLHSAGHGGTDMFAEKPQQIDKARAIALLKAAAGKRCGAEGRPERQVRSQRAGAPRDRPCPDRRYHGDELRS
jgi:DNA polymerase-1